MSVEWEALSTDQANYIDQFLIANVGLPFNWAPPFSAINYVWDCKAWRREKVYGPIDKITANLVQRFDLQ